MLILSEVRWVRETLAEALGQSLIFPYIHGVSSLAEASAQMDIADPALVLIDATLRGGLAAVRWLRKRDPASRLIAFNMAEAAPHIATWTEAGIVACLGCSATLKEIVEMIGTLMNGEFLALAPAVAAPGRAAESRSNRLTGVVGATAVLTPREEEVVRLIIVGESNKEIARLLNISVPTVKSHVHNLLGKLGLERRGKLALRYEAVND